MLQRSTIFTLALASMVAAVTSRASAGVTVYEKDDTFVEIGGRLQLQYHLTDPDGGDSEDDLFFRRLRPYIAGSATEDWEGKFQFDIGKASDGNEVAVKDAYMRYTGLKNFKITLGNQKPPFSREFLTSSKRQQLVERTFVGDHNFGSPDRMLGVRLDGKSGSKKLAWGASLGSAAIDPDAKKLDFDSPANANSDFNEGWLAAGRIDFHPLGELKMEQGDFKGETKFTVSLAAFSWANDDDNNGRTSGGTTTSSSKPDVDSANGFEISAGLRTHGLSVDAQVQVVDAETVDRAFTGGLYRAGDTQLDIFAVEGGYMLHRKFEIVGGYESLDADGYQDAWNRTSFGANYFWNKHKVKWQLTYRIGENVNGVTGADQDELFLQWQFVF